MKKIKLFSILSFIFFSILNNIHGQGWQWTKHFGSVGDDGGYLTVDNNNNEYIYGLFTGPFFFINGDTLQLIDGNLFVAKLNSTGNTIWIKQINAANLNCYFDHSVIVSNVDNSIYLFGGYCDSMTSTCSNIYSTAGNEAMYITKLDSSGNCQWAKKIDGLDWDLANACTLDDSNNLYVASEHWKPAQIDSAHTFAGNVISKYDVNGSLLWTKNVCPLTPDNHPRPEIEIESIKYKNGNLYINALQRSDTVTFNSTSIYHDGQRGCLIAKLTIDADLIWYRQGLTFIYSGYTSFDGFSIDDSENVYATGVFPDSIEFDGYKMYGDTLMPNYEIYLVKYDSTGLLQWGRHFHTGNNEYVFSTTSNTGITYVTSCFYDSIDLGNYHLYPSGRQEMFLAAISPDGNCLGVKHFGEGIGVHIRLDNNNDVLVLSNSTGTATLDQDTYPLYGGTYDLILSKCSAITGIDNVEKEKGNELTIYANPTNGKCNITIPDEFMKTNSTLTLSLYDNSGKVIRSFPVKIQDGTIKLDLEYEATGIYFVTLSDGQKIYRGKIVFE